MMIRNARHEIEDIQEETPSLNDAAIKALWDRCFRDAKRDAEDEMNTVVSIANLTWEQVFDQEYKLV